MYFKVIQYPLHFSLLLGWVLECFNLESDSGLSINYSHREHFVFYRVPSGEKNNYDKNFELTMKEK